MTDDKHTNDSDNQNFRDQLEDFMKMCENLRTEAQKNGLDVEKFNALMASVLQEEESAKQFKETLQHTKVEAFLETCRELRAQAAAQGMSKERLDIEMIAAFMDNQEKFSNLKAKQDEKEKQSMLAKLAESFKKPSGPSR